MAAVAVVYSTYFVNNQGGPMEAQEEEALREAFAQAGLPLGGSVGGLATFSHNFEAPEEFEDLNDTQRAKLLGGEELAVQSYFRRCLKKLPSGYSFVYLAPLNLDLNYQRWAAPSVIARLQAGASHA